MKISSISDVITNSSNEVFTIIHPEDIDRIKLVINTILRLGNSSKTCDDILNIKWDWDWDYIKNEFETDFGMTPNVSKETLKEYAWKRITEAEEGYGLHGIVPDLKISAKSGEKLPNEFYYFADMFADHEEMCC